MVIHLGAMDGLVASTRPASAPRHVIGMLHVADIKIAARRLALEMALQAQGLVPLGQ